jgi:cell wall-associated NlpC family hydrolase
MARGRIAVELRRSASFRASPTANPAGEGKKGEGLSRCRTLAIALVAGAVVLPVAQADAARRAFGTRSLHVGMRGTDVRVLQDFLTKWGVRTTVDGIYGRGTASRVRTWERATNRPVDGRMSRADSAELRRAVEAGETRPGVQSDQVATPTEKATIGADGLAVAPASAPDPVKAMIAAGNQIATMPYKYGGGHGQWDDTGYDCSGSMSYVMHAAGLLDVALDSTEFESYGEAGEGQWVTIYANSGHSYMLIAGLRFDTSGRADDGSRWHDSMRPSSGYVVRHPPGL